MTETPPDCPGAPAPTAPRLPLPKGACDTHLHVLGPYDRYPLAPKRAYTVPEAPLSDLRRYMSVTGIERVVIAHVSAAGRDMDVTLDAIAALGDAARGTMMPEPDHTHADLVAYHERGMRGLRLSGGFGFPVTQDTMADAARRIGDLPWHIAIWTAGAADLDMLAALPSDYPVPIVLDHLAAFGWFRDGEFDADAFDRLRALLDSGRVYLKLSAPFRATPQSAPWPALHPHVSRLVAEVPERLIWASDWPHVGLLTDNMPYSGDLLDWLDDLGCGAATRQKILVDTPAALYGFTG